MEEVWRRAIPIVHIYSFLRPGRPCCIALLTMMIRMILQAKMTLREAYDSAGIDAEIEVYSGALHGWCAIDSQVYNLNQAENAWTRLLNLFATNLA